jgi:hypothetical protein
MTITTTTITATTSIHASTKITNINEPTINPIYCIYILPSCKFNLYKQLHI